MFLSPAKESKIKMAVVLAVAVAVAVAVVLAVAVVVEVAKSYELVFILLVENIVRSSVQDDASGWY